MVEVEKRSEKLFSITFKELEGYRETPVRVERDGIAVELSVEDAVGAILEENYGMERLLAAVVRFSVENGRPAAREAGEKIKRFFPE